MLRSLVSSVVRFFFFFFQAEDGIRDPLVTGVQTCALPISPLWAWSPPQRRGRHALRRFPDAHSSPGCFLLRLARTAFWQLMNCRAYRQQLGTNRKVLVNSVPVHAEFQVSEYGYTGLREVQVKNSLPCRGVRTM